MVKDTDLLKYLLVMLLSGVTYMTAFTALSLDMRAENVTMLETMETNNGEQFQVCVCVTFDICKCHCQT